MKRPVRPKGARTAKPAARAPSRTAARRAAAGKAGPGAADVDAYLAALPPPFRTALAALRTTIRSAAPRAAETISYRIPTFVHAGPLVAFSASAGHCALHLMSPPLVRALAAELAPYEVGTATLRFTPDAPLPPALVRRLVRARRLENERRARR